MVRHRDTPTGGRFAFDGDGRLFRLASEALRIRLAHLSDPYAAVHASRIEPLPHQLTAVYGAMLDRQPLRFLLADDPGAGKTIMTGLPIEELAVPGRPGALPGHRAGRAGGAMARRTGGEVRHSHVPGGTASNPTAEPNRRTRGRSLTIQPELDNLGVTRNAA